MNCGDMLDRIQELTGGSGDVFSQLLVVNISRRVLSEIHSFTKCSERMQDITPGTPAGGGEVVCNMPLDFLSLQCIWNAENKVKLQPVNGFELKTKVVGWRSVTGEPLCYYYSEMNRATSYRQVGLWPLLEGLDEPVVPTATPLVDPSSGSTLPDLGEG
jgi:hypothetical protein